MADPQSHRRTRINRPYPTHDLESVLSIARTIHEVNAGLPMDRPLLAAALRTTPSSSSFRMRLSSSEKYSLTDGGYNDERISLTSLGRSAVSPASAEELRQAMVSAATAPDIFRRFYAMLAGKRLPENVYAENVLTRDLQVRPELAEECLAIIRANGVYAGILKDSAGETLVDYQAATDSAPTPKPTVIAEAGESAADAEVIGTGESASRIFIGYIGYAGNIGETHPSTSVDMLRDTLVALGVEPVDRAVALDGSAALVSPEVSRAMKRCSAAAIFAPGCDGEDEGQHHDYVDQVSMILIGAASVLYGPKVVFIHPGSPEGPPGPPGVVSVNCQPGRPEAAVLATLQALFEAGAIRAVAPGD